MSSEPRFHVLLVMPNYITSVLFSVLTWSCVIIPSFNVPLKLFSGFLLLNERNSESGRLFKILWITTLTLRVKIQPLYKKWNIGGIALE